jgi:hypothetical protein
MRTKTTIACGGMHWPKPSYLAYSIALMIGAMGAGSAGAMPIETGNPDLNINWDNTIRYNAGWRMEGRNKDFNNSPAYDDTEHKFDSGDMVTNRLDVITEFDAIWKNTYGVRVSAAGWYDDVYQDSAEPNPALGRSGNYRNNHYNGYTDRYISGPSGEFLDAFVFGNYQLGSMTGNLKVGQHNVYWGESLYSIGNSIAYSQGPVNTIKAATSPGSEAKELFMPLKQISTQLQLTDDLSIAAQYLLDWKPFRLVPGGTYFAPSDGSRSDLGNTAASGFEIPNGKDVEPDHQSGDFGLNLRWSPWWLGGTVGAYYRRFDEKLPWSFTQLQLRQFAPGVVAVVPSAVRLAYARDTELYGLSISQTLGTVSVAGELSYRKNTALNSVAGYTVLPGNGTSPTYSEVEGARGDSWHALVNAIYLLPKTPLWDGGTLQGEIAYNHLDKITDNPDRFNARGYGCTSGYSKNCVDRGSLGTQIGFTPQWPQLFPGWDVSMPMSVAYGINGNSPTLGGTNEGAYNYSVGVSGVWKNLHTFSLTWLDSHAEYKNDPATGYATNGYTNGSAVQNDHGWLSFTYKTTF